MYHYQSTFVHGIPLMGPGLPQGFPQCPKKRPRPVNNWPSSLISSCARPGLFSNKDYQGGQQGRTIGRCPHRHTIDAAHGILQFREYALSDHCVVSTGGCRPDCSHTNLKPPSMPFGWQDKDSVDDLVILFALLCLLTLSHYIHLPHVLLQLLLWVPFSLVSSGELEI